MFFIIDFITGKRLIESESAKTTVSAKIRCHLSSRNTRLTSSSCNATYSAHAATLRILVEFDYSSQDLQHTFSGLHIVSLPAQFIQRPRTISIDIDIVTCDENSGENFKFKSASLEFTPFVPIDRRYSACCFESREIIAQ